MIKLEPQLSQDKTCSKTIYVHFQRITPSTLGFYEHFEQWLKMKKPVNIEFAGF